MDFVIGKSGDWGSDLSEADDILYPHGDPVPLMPARTGKLQVESHEAELTIIAVDSLNEMMRKMGGEEEHPKAHMGN
jgi:hypothetical protein